MPQYTTYAPRPSGFIPRLLYRKDGSPRNKKFGFFLTVVTAVGGTSLLILAQDLLELDLENAVLMTLILMMRVDSYYPSLDLASDDAVLDHLARFCSALFDPASAPAVDALVGFVRTMDPALRARALDIVRQETREIHALLEKLDRDFEKDLGMDLIPIAEDVREVAIHAFYQLLEVIGEASQEVEFAHLVKHIPQPKNDPKDKDPESDYELVQ
ncbi:hypothetical protein K523DRAFT_341656 [Schizophyllum commune Tattone D]|nr:hypothetical protein K523DRAFT_341656 [Schizophyllum commune Tattone D]